MLERRDRLMRARNLLAARVGPAKTDEDGRTEYERNGGRAESQQPLRVRRKQTSVRVHRSDGVWASAKERYGLRERYPAGLD